MRTPPSFIRQRQGGHVLLLVALSAIMLIAAVGLAIDSGLGYLVKAKLNAAVDSASLAAARGVTLGDNQTAQAANARQAAREFFDVNYPDKYLLSTPVLNPVAPRGSNVEFVRPLGPGHIRMRVHERGVGETRSCGTGACAAALAVRAWAGADAPDDWRVLVPGGELGVRALPGGRVELSGPAALVAEVRLL